MSAPRYAEFAVASNFSFLRGASHPEELIAQAEALGLSGMGLCDRNSVAGVVRAHVAKRETGLTLWYHPGARLVFCDGTPDILAYPRDRPAWGRLCRLLTRGNLRAKKGECLLHRDDLFDFLEGLELVVMERSTFADTSPLPPAAKGVAPPPLPTARPVTDDPLRDLALRLHDAARGRVRLAASMLYRGQDRAALARLHAFTTDVGLPPIAVNDVLLHHPDRRPLADILTCIRTHTTLQAAGRSLAANAERHLKPPAEMARLFRDMPEAVTETLALSEALTFSLDELRYEYPDEARQGFATAQEALVHFTYEGAAQRYPNGVPDKVRRGLAYELDLIAGLNYAPYFLTVHDIVRFARANGILCQGRGSAANSAVCYCLGVTEVDPDRADLLFERFVSPERREPPDIDVDFEHERREEVIQYIYARYGRERAGLAATVISYRGRSAIREVGKAFGLSEDTVARLSSSIWGGGGMIRDDDLRRHGLDVSGAQIRKILACFNEIQSFPRHLSQHVGGFVITKNRLDDVVPIQNAAMENRTVIEWDKDDLDALGILKVDVLGLGMLTCVRRALDLVTRHYDDGALAPASPSSPLGLAHIPAEDPAVYRMLRRADSLGVFQVESRAQMTMLPRLKPDNFYDLVIEVAIVRPGPIQGDMVHPYLRRRQGLEPVTFPSKALEGVLGKTLGVPLFQEQAMRIAIVAAGFTPSEADKLRRAMATFKRVGTISTFQRKMIDGMVANGYDSAFAERCFHQIEGFGEYGFPESHAASFALLVYASAWLKCRYPDAFAAALLNSQPMGFYAPAQIVRDVREHGVEVRPVDINHSVWDATLEPGARASERLHAMHEEMRPDVRAACAIRLGLREVKGLREEDACRIAALRHTGGREGAYDSVRDLWLRTGLAPAVLERLADADAFASLGLSRRDALWAVKALGRVGDRDDDLPLFRAASGRRAEGCDQRREPDVHLPPMPLGEEVVNDYRFLRLSLRAHPATFLRDDLARRGIVPNERLRAAHTRTMRVTVSGLVTVRQRPGSAKGVIFMTIEDESGIANIIVWPTMFERFRPVVLGARYVAVHGRVQEECGVVHVVADQIDDLTFLLARLAAEEDIHGLARADEVKRPQDDYRDKRPRNHRQASALMHDAPELAADLDVQARATRHVIAKRRG